eukprot:Opistho-2@65831
MRMRLDLEGRGRCGGSADHGHDRAHDRDAESPRRPAHHRECRGICRDRERRLDHEQAREIGGDRRGFGADDRLAQGVAVDEASQGEQRDGQCRRKLRSHDHEAADDERAETHEELTRRQADAGEMGDDARD